MGSLINWCSTLSKMALAAYALECAGLVWLALRSAFWMDPPYFGVYNLSSGRQCFHYNSVTQLRWLISCLIKFLFFCFFSFPFFSSLFLLPPFFLLQKKKPTPPPKKTRAIEMFRTVEVIPLIKICFPDSTSFLLYYICLLHIQKLFISVLNHDERNVFFFEHVAQVSLKLAMQWMTILNFRPSCLHVRGRVTGVYHWD